MDMADLENINNQVKQLESDQIKSFVKLSRGLPIIMDFNLTGTNMCISVSPKLYDAVIKERRTQSDGRSKENPASG